MKKPRKLREWQVHSVLRGTKLLRKHTRPGLLRLHRPPEPKVALSSPGSLTSLALGIPQTRHFQVRSVLTRVHQIPTDLLAAGKVSAPPAWGSTVA